MTPPTCECARRLLTNKVRVSDHTFRHGFAGHLLQANYDIRTIQKLLDYSDVRTTMIYTHTIKSLTIKEAKMEIPILLNYDTTAPGVEIYST